MKKHTALAHRLLSTLTSLSQGRQTSRPDGFSPNVGLACALLACLPGLASAQPADALAEATRRLGELHARPVSTPEDSAALATAEQAWVQALKARALKAVGEVGFAPDQAELQLVLDQLWRSAQPWSYQGDFGEAMPDWLLPALRQRIQRLDAGPAANAARPGSIPAPGSGGWQGLHEYSTRFDDTGLFIWSGPAVRDGVSQYLSSAGRTRLRLNLGSLGTWRWLALARGVPVQLALEDAGQPVPWVGPWPVTMRLRLPLWLASAQSAELMPALLVRVSQSAQCEDNYAEFEISGERQPPIWAVLALPDEASGRAGRVKRIPHPAAFLEGEQASGNGATVRSSRLELSWPGSAIPALHLVARGFGETWGSYAVLASQANAPHKPDSYALIERISGAGTPECAPRPITP